MAHNSVGHFVRQAFPEGTIPCDNPRSHRDFSSNHLAYSDNWQKQNADEVRFSILDDQKFSQFPIWPADTFAISATVLEKSAAYQRLADKLVPFPPDKAYRNLGGKWSDYIDPAPPHDIKSDPFGTHMPHRIVLRLIGALWASGALVSSGRFDESNFETGDNLIRKNDIRAHNATLFMKERLDRECSPEDIDKLVECITKRVIKRLRLEELVAHGYKKHSLNSRISSTGVSALAVKKIISRTIKEGDINDNLRNKEIPYLCLVHWASEYIQYHWRQLVNSKRPLLQRYAELSLPDDDPVIKKDIAWWRAAMRLLIISDEAGKGMGFSPRNEAGADGAKYHDGAPQAGATCQIMWEAYWREADNAVAEEELRRGLRRYPRTLTRCFDENLGAVLPKARTVGIGCTIRSLSFNFALLPPKGRIRARWAGPQNHEARSDYNLLLIPYPYKILSKDVIPETPNSSPEEWGFFSIKPRWLDDVPLSRNPNAEDMKIEDTKVGGTRETANAALWKFVESLLNDQPKETIQGVVFPEGALDWEAFEHIQSRLISQFHSVEMLVCGLTSARLNRDEKIRPGNFAATYMRKHDTVCNSVDGVSEPTWALRHVRAKHHRWRLDAQQLKAYAFSNRLSPDKVWWEKIDLPPREMLFAEFGSGSIVTTLICEDLARIEPCQVAIRSIGPNLVLVLLMDNAQVIKRWPYQYAGVLTDDPGSSILTITSFGLINRSNLSEGRESREFAMWREPHTGVFREISLPKGYAAQLLTLRREFCREVTLDGRGNNSDSSIVWRFAGLIPIKATERPPGGFAD